MTAPFAEYELTGVPDFPGFECSMGVGSRLVLDPKVETICSRRPEDTIFVKGSSALYERGWGGTRNHLVAFSEGAWWVHDLGHARPVRVGGERVRGSRQLRHGMRVEPAAGLVFTFLVRDDLEALAAEAHLARSFTAPQGKAVLLDWVMERLGGDRPSAERALQHFHYRLAHAGTL
jgi:hypothetical protein